MSERKVLNKYYPPDFDPSKIPRMKLAKNRQYTVRLMAPFNMRCVTCGEYIYKGKKFNARKEDVEGEDYLGIRIFRFYIKCTRCLQEISFRTDPKNTDYEIEAGATRNFMALKLAEEQAQKEEDERVADEATNPMKLLENRTKQSKQELELLESLEELKDLNKRQRSIDYDSILSQYSSGSVKTEAEQEIEDEEYIKSVFKKPKVISDSNVVIEQIVEDVENTEQSKPVKYSHLIKDEDSDYSVPKKVAKQDTVSTSLPVTANKKNNLLQSMSIMGGGLRKQKYSALVKTKSETNTKTQNSMLNSGKISSEFKTANTSSSGALSMLGTYSDSDNSE